MRVRSPEEIKKQDKRQQFNDLYEIYLSIKGEKNRQVRLEKAKAIYAKKYKRDHDIDYRIFSAKMTMIKEKDLPFESKAYQNTSQKSKPKLNL